NIVVTYSDPTAAKVAAGAQLVGPDGPVAQAADTTTDSYGVRFDAPPLAEATTYDVVIDGAPLFHFTTRGARPRAAAPTLVALNGTAPTALATPFRPFTETSTVRLVFSEPLDPRTVAYEPGSVELVDAAGALVPATLVASGIHVAIDPTDDLTAGAVYTVRLGNKLADLDGHIVSPAIALPLTPLATRSGGPIPQILRTRQKTDPGPARSRSGAARNVIAMASPLIGDETATMQPSALHAELADPLALDGPIAFTIRKGGRLSTSSLDVKLAGSIPSGLTTGDIQIEILTDAEGRLYRNPYRPADQRPENANAPLFVDLVLDLAVYAKDPKGNAVLAQTILGVQATGTVIATGGVLAIETVAAMDLGLLGLANAPTNFVLELITDPTATVDADTQPPTLVAAQPTLDVDTLPVGAGIEILFDEPIDLARAQAGGVQLVDDANVVIPTVIESHGAAIVVRPRASLVYNRRYQVELTDVADLAGNPLGPKTLEVRTEEVANTDVPLTIAAVYPGAPCALASGHCAGGADGDDAYQPFTLPANESIQVAFTQPPIASTIVLGTACNSGSVRVERVDGAGACLDVVPGTMIVRDRSLEFVPDAPWVTDEHYRLSLISGNNQSCGAGEACGINGEAASFDPLAGTEGNGSGGPNLTIPFTGAAASTSTFVLVDTAPITDTNGSGFVDGSEQPRDANRAALRITGTTGSVGSAEFTSPDCIPATPEVEACMYLQGAMPVEMGELATTGCPAGAATCIPVTVSAQAMYATSVSMTTSVGISISTDTGTTVMRIREPANTPLLGYIIDRGGVPTMVVALDLYMDAPDMSVPLSSHDLHSKPLSVSLEGPVTFLPDGRLAIALANLVDVPVAVSIDNLLLSGSVEMIVPAGEMKLQLVSPPLRGVER
ncbi:MAG: Ig-like domain-containing protein, partial [Proteobacteria bacterium]|nr:Ig-like domain-containing protein [Pseudomonadota bacterium]